jgi:LPS-assembly protein
MPPLMLRSSPFRILIVLLGGIMPIAWAADPPCPSQNPAQAGVANAVQSAKPPANTTPTHLTAGGKIEASADSVEGSVAEGKATLKGNVVVRLGERVIKTDEAQLDRNQAAVQTDSHIDYNDPLVEVSGASGRYSQSEGAEFRAAQFALHQRPARGAAQDLSLSPQGVVSLKGVTFTTCPVNDNSWRLKASSIVLDTRNKIGTGRDTQIDFMGVPLMYLPWVSFPLSSERKSGFLFPTIGNTSYGGLQLSLPYYWNIAPNFDFTFEPTEYTHSGLDLGGELRFLTESQHGEVDWNYLPHDKTFGGSRDRVRLDDVADLPDFWRLHVHAEEVSDPFYFEDFSQGPEGASTAFLDRSANFSYRDQHWRVDAGAQQYQTIDYTLAEEAPYFGADNPPNNRPYARVPRIAVSSDYTLGPQGIFHYGFDSEVVNFQAPGGLPEVNGWRADITPGISLDLTGAGYFLRPALAWRGTFYDLNNVPLDKPGSPSRTLPIASVDTGLMFERLSGSHDQRKLTLEPRVLYLRVPYRNQDDLPVFDTALPDLLNTVELFRTNRYVGADRMSDADQVSVGVTSRLLDAQNGRQFISGTFGQIYYFEPPRVTLPPPYYYPLPAGVTLPGVAPIDTGKRSDLVAQIALTAFQDWSAGIGVQWDPQISESEHTEANVQYKPAPDTVVNLDYRYERFVFDQVELSGAWPIRNNWSVFARGIYSLSDHEYTASDLATTTPLLGTAPIVSERLVGFLERFVGFEYRSCCWRLRFGVRRYVNSHTGSQDTGLWLQLELAGLASVGSASDASLGQEIRGYIPPENVNPKNQGPLRGVW